MDFKFTIDQQVAVADHYTGGYIEPGQTGVVKRAIILSNKPEYLVVLDEREYSNVAVWFIREQDLVAVK
jgi:hypothetical protein